MAETLTEGGKFGDYEVVRQLGKGGMGEVWLLKDTSQDAYCATKILDPAVAGDHESRRRLLREAEIAMSVEHLNLVEVYDVAEDPETGLCYILMEYIPGGTLADLLGEIGPLPLNDALKVVRAIASVLETVQEKGIVHRDIKPDNIMFGIGGVPKLADLGIARINRSETMTMTKTGMFVGTPAYMSPEQMVDSRKVDVRADIYSLGIVLFEMLAGRRPFAEESVAQAMARAVKRTPVPDVRRYRKVPVPVAMLVRRMCEPDAANRISSPTRIIDYCTKIIEGRNVFIAPYSRRQAEADGPQAAASRHGRRSHISELTAAETGGGGGLLVVVVVLLLLAMLAGGLYLALQYGAKQAAAVPPADDDDAQVVRRVRGL